NKIVIATPMTLIALLRTVAYGWRQETLRENVLQVADMGRKLYGALASFTGHLETVGSRLGSAVEAYNKTVGALERNVMGKARRLAECGL
ncbi:DNA recombination protein RmuC, partial [Klebsiella pneumoniae]|uniref:DNA recombination protein RmuC n=1 Tax=Klebsiella pneumoniae TaxID=573 RepID=UPI0027300E80